MRSISRRPGILNIVANERACLSDFEDRGSRISERCTYSSGVSAKPSTKIRSRTVPLERTSKLTTLIWFSMYGNPGTAAYCNELVHYASQSGKQSHSRASS